MSERMKFPGDEFVLRMHIEFVADDGERDEGAKDKQTHFTRTKIVSDDSYHDTRKPGTRRPVGQAFVAREP